MNGAGAWEVRRVLSRGACWFEVGDRRKNTDAGEFGGEQEVESILASFSVKYQVRPFSGGAVGRDGGDGL